MQPFHFRLLGAFEAHHGQEPILLRKPRPRSLLAYLLLHRDEAQTRHGLADLFWPDSPESQARTNLRNLLFRVRKALPDPEALLEVGAVHIRIRPDATVELDVEQAQALVRRIEDHDGPAEALLELLQQARSWLRGPLLPGCRDPWVFEPRERLDRLAGEVADDLASQHERGGDLRAAIRVSREALVHNPALEVLHRRLIRVLAAEGDRAGALRAYHGCVEALAGVGAVPSSTTEALVAELRMGSGEERGSRTPFVGRAQAWDTLTGMLEASDGRPRVVCLRGEAGIGKTRLADEACRWARRQGLITATARSHPGSTKLALVPVADWLRAPSMAASLRDLSPEHQNELSRLVPELAAGLVAREAPAALEHDWQRTRFFEVLAHAFEEAGVALLHLDDVQWSDPSTLQWLHHLLQRRGAAPLVLVTERTGEARPEGLDTLQRDLERQGGWTSVDLAPLGPEECVRLAASLAPDCAPATLRSLCDESEGNPLFLEELAKQRGGSASRSGQGLPSRLKQVISARVGAVGAEGLALARALAVCGGEVAWPELVAVSDLQEGPAADGLDDLWARGLIRERGTDTYGFAHEKFREVLLAEIPPGRRRLLHGRAAAALTRLARHPWSRVAHHLEGAGRPIEAVGAHLQAAEHALEVFANREARHHFRSAIVLGRGRVDTTIVAQAELQLAGLLNRSATPAEVLAHVEEAMAQQPSQLQEARLCRWQAVAFTAQNRYVEAEQSLHRGLKVLGPPADRPEYLHALIDLWLGQMRFWYWQGKPEPMAELRPRMAPLVEAHGDARQRAAFHISIATLLHRERRYGPDPESVAHCEAAMEAVQGIRDQRYVAEVAFMVGFSRMWARRYPEAMQALEGAAASSVKTGDAWLELRVRTYLCFWMRLHRDPRLAAEVDAAEQLAMRLEKPAYVAVAQAQRAVLAWRAGDVADAEHLAEAAQASWASSQLAYPFQWSALLVLLAVHVDQQRPTQDLMTALGAPSQQVLPPTVQQALKDNEAADAVAAATSLGML